MTQCARQETKCQPIPLSTLELWLDVEVLAERYEDLLALPTLEDEPQGEADDAEEEASDDLPF